MAETKTQKEMFAEIAELLADNAEVVEFCNKKIEQLSKPRVKKENPEVAAFRETVLAAMGEDEITAKDLAEGMSTEDAPISWQKVSSALRALAAEGKVVATDNGKDAKTYVAA